MDDQTLDRWVGKVLASRFQVERRLGAGGMGEVYLARQLGVERRVVVELVRPGLRDHRAEVGRSGELGAQRQPATA